MEDETLTILMKSEFNGITSCETQIKQEFESSGDTDNMAFFKTEVKLEPLDEPLEPHLEYGFEERNPSVEGAPEPKVEIKTDEEILETSFVNVQEYLDVVIEDSEKTGINPIIPEKKIILKKPTVVCNDPFANMLHKCLRCSATFKSIYLLREHTISHKISNLKHIKCKKCDFKCVKMEMMTKHNYLHDETRRFKCDLCTYRFKTKVCMTVHMKVHSMEKKYPCHLCELKFTRYFELRAHLKIHVEEMLLKCEYCDYRCKFQHLMKRHMRIHTGEYPYKCDYCDYKSNFSANLQSHVRTHTGECFKCDYCDYSCIRKGHLKTHIRTHTGEKPFKCIYCKYKCNRNGDLKIHMRIHTGEKPYKCDLCDYRCSDSGSLRYHTKKHNKHNSQISRPVT